MVLIWVYLGKKFEQNLTSSFQENHNLDWEFLRFRNLVDWISEGRYILYERAERDHVEFLHKTENFGVSTMNAYLRGLLMNQ
jgi:hypothetical protein